MEEEINSRQQGGWVFWLQALWKSWYLNWPMMELNKLGEMQRIYLATERKLIKAQKFKDLYVHVKHMQAHSPFSTVSKKLWKSCFLLKLQQTYLWHNLTWADMRLFIIFAYSTYENLCKFCCRNINAFLSPAPTYRDFANTVNIHCTTI